MQRTTKITVIVSVILAASVTAFAQVDDTPRVKVPDKAAQGSAEKLINDIFKEDFENAKDAAAKLKLAAELVKQADETEDLAARYVLYRSGRDLAAAAGDANLAIQAVEKMARRFDVPALDLKAATLLAVSKAVDKNAAKELAELALGLISEALDADNYGAAEEFGKVALAAATKAQIIDKINAVKKRNLEVAAVKKGFSSLQKFVDRLKNDPKDAQANLELGKYYAFLKGKWDRAIPLLALGSDETLKALAQKDLAKPKEGKDQLDIADGWWDLAEKEKEPAKTYLLQRAGHWYDQAAPNLTGLFRTKAQKRFDKILELTKGIAIPIEKVGELKLFKGHTDGIRCVALSPDGRYALSGGDDRTARVWDVQNGQEIQVIRDHTDKVYGVSFVNNKEFLSSSWDDTVKMWEVKKPNQIRVFTHSKDANGIMVSRDGKWLVTGCDDEKVRLWDVSKAAVVKEYTGHTNFVLAVALSPDGQLVASGSQDKTIRVYDREKTNLVARMEQGNAVTFVAFSADSRYVFSSGDDAVHMWDAKTGKEFKKFAASGMGLANGLAVSPDGRRLLTATDDKMVRLWDTASGKEIVALKGHTGAVLCVAFSSDGQRALSGSIDHSVRLWSLPAR